MFIIGGGLFSGCSLDADLLQLSSRLEKSKIVAELTSVSGERSNQNSLPLVLSFSDDVEDITATDLIVTNGTVRNFAGSGKIYTFTIDVENDGPVSVTFASKKIQLVMAGKKIDTTIDQASAQIEIDRTPLTVVLSNPGPSSSGVLPFTVNVVFSKPVSGLSASDFVVSSSDGGTGFLSPVPTGSGKIYSLTYYATTSGSFQISLPVGAIRDEYGNTSLASNDLSFSYSGITPTLNITGPTPALGNQNSSFEWIIDYADAASIHLSGVTLLGDTAGCVETLTNHGLNSKKVSVFGCTANTGTVGFSVAAGSATSSTGNTAPAMTATAATLDNVGPTLSLSSPTPLRGTSATSFQWTASYTEASQVHLQSSDITLTGASVGCAISVNNIDTTKSEISVLGCTGDGALGLEVAAGVARDTLGNLSGAASATLGVTVDNTPPTLAIAGPTPDVGKASDSFEWSLTYSGADTVTLGDTDITLITTGMVSGCTKTLSSSGSPRIVSVTGCSGDGTVVIQVAANTASDLVGHSVLHVGAAPTLATVDNAPDPRDPAFANDLFISEWDTRYIVEEEYNPEMSSKILKLPLVPGVAYDFKVDWGDGSPVQRVTTDQVEHTYSTDGLYTVKMLGSFPRLAFGDGDNSWMLKGVNQWGTNSWVSMERMFYNCTELTLSANDTPDLSRVSSMKEMFDSVRYFSSNSVMGSWDTSQVEDMTRMFAGSYANPPIGNWNVSKVSSMREMFRGNQYFNTNLNWNTVSVTDMADMFHFAVSFNQPIGNWNTANVTDMSQMFSYASNFNQPIGNWNTAKVTSMAGMFNSSTKFNQAIGNWNTSSVTDMSNMFNEAKAFNQPIGSWNTSLVENMNSMFANASAFNQAINTVGSSWNTSKVTTMVFMFRGSGFNQSISNWNTSKVTSMAGMFSSATLFNQPLASWDTGNVTSFSDMFWGAKNFNQAIGNWNTAKVTTMAGMFCLATAFNQTIGGWNTSNVTSMSAMFYRAENFDQPLASWDTSKVIYMSSMFEEAKKFNRPIGGWNTANVISMSSMFSKATLFNQPIGNWNLIKVESTLAMFSQATAFNQPLGGWNTSNVVYMDSMFNSASSFNQDLTTWNVSKVITRAPWSNFSAGAVSWNAAYRPKPGW